MFFYEGLHCGHCRQQFREEDDIVACPVCGAPHHRDCWKDEGGCAFADAHGTERQWSRDTAAVTQEDAAAPQTDVALCPHCGKENSPYAEMCAYCGQPLIAREWHSAPPPPPDYAPPTGGFGEYQPFHAAQAPMGGVTPQTVIEGESAKDIAAVVATNTAYYLPRFERLSKSGGKVSWNWAAFLIPSYWLMFRKHYIAGAVVLAFQLVCAVITQLVAQTYFASALMLTDTQAMVTEMMRLLETNPTVYLASSLIGLLGFVQILLNVGIGLFGNWLYMRRCVKIIGDTRREYPEGYAAQLSLLGGVSLALGFIAYLCLEFVPLFITALVMT